MCLLCSVILSEMARRFVRCTPSHIRRGCCRPRGFVGPGGVFHWREIVYHFGRYGHASYVVLGQHPAESAVY
jgi:hypothetical protein